MEIVTRAEWGAKPARSRHYIDTPTPRLWIHHTAGALDQNGNGVWWDDVLGIQDFHMRPVSEGGRGWSDIAYSFLVGGGQVFEGRGAGIAGGHTKGDNSSSHAICLIGSYDFMTPQPKDLRAIADLARHGREQGWWGEITGGHRNAPGASTACPGRHLQAAIPELRALAGIPQPEDDMTPEERQMLREIHESIVGRKTGTAGGLIHDYSKATRTDVQIIRKHIEAASDDE
jgi:hypothetical protein